MTQVIEKTGAGEGNRTLVISLEGRFIWDPRGPDQHPKHD
jgi:hypothetical protein